METALTTELQEFEKVVIIGTDSPTLPPRFVDEAFGLLEQQDVVLGPACDGGYFLIGARGTAPRVFPQEMPWGTETVLTKTMARLVEQGVSFGLLPFWYDVDRPEDLSLLKLHLTSQGHSVFRPTRTIALLQELSSDE